MLQENNDLHATWRGIIMLLTLVSAINNAGHPRLLGRNRPAYQSILNKAQTQFSAMLNAIASVIVRSTEIIAISVSSTSSPQILAFQEGETTVVPAPVDLGLTEEEEWDDLSCFQSRLAAIANPDKKDKKFDDIVRLSLPGESFWPEIKGEQSSFKNYLQIR